MAKIDCSELSKEIYLLVKSLLRHPGVKNIDDTVAKMNKMPGLEAVTREYVVVAINEAAESNAHVQDDFAKTLSAVVGEAKRDRNLRAAAKDLQNHLKNKTAPEPTKPKAKAATPDAILKLQAEKSALELKVRAATAPGDVSAVARSMAKAFVAKGVTERNSLVDAVHKELLEVSPDITRRQVADAISGYGQFKSLSQDEVAAKLRDLKGQLQQVSKLEDMAAGNAPAKTGVERRDPSDEERHLIQQVNEAKRKGGFVVTDPATQLKSSLDSIKTRLRHQISDLQQQINTRRKIVKNKTLPPSDLEVASLIKQRDELNKQYKEIFGNNGMTDAQRLGVARKAVEKSIAEYERRLEAGDFTARRPDSKTPTSPELDALRAKRDALKKKYDAANPDTPAIRQARTRLAELERHLEDGTLPPVKTKKATASPKLATLQDKVATLRKALGQSTPALRKRFEKSIAELTRRLEEGDYLPAVRRENIPLNKELERLQYDRDQLRKTIRRRIASMQKKTAWELLAEPGNFARAMLTMGEFSATGIQGGTTVLGHPIKGAGWTVASLKAFASERVTWKIDQDIHARDNAPLYARAKLYIAPIDSDSSINEKEEAFMSRLAGRVPLVRRSERAYVTFLNKLRADMFDMMASVYPDGPTQVQAESIANYINVATGRAYLGKKLEQAAPTAAQLLFSPRLQASRVLYTVGQPLWRGGIAPGLGRVRRQIAMEYARTMLGMAAFIALGVAAGGDFEKDLRSSDFGKLRFGNTRVNLPGGLNTIPVFLARILWGETKSTTSGRVNALRGDKHRFGMPDTTDIMKNFLRSKLAPMPGAVVNIIQTENYVGQNTDITTLDGSGRMAKGMLIPMTYPDIYDVMIEQGLAKGTVMSVFAMFGISLQTYKPRQRKKKRGK